jgi:hypothetical protein
LYIKKEAAQLVARLKLSTHLIVAGRNFGVTHFQLTPPLKGEYQSVRVSGKGVYTVAPMLYAQPTVTAL